MCLPCTILTVCAVHIAIAGVICCTPGETMAERQPSVDLCSDEENEGCDNHEKILELELKKSFKSIVSNVLLGRDSHLLTKIQLTCEEVLKDITELPSIGAPGKLIIYGENTIPVLAAGDAQGVCITGSEVGKGRVVLLSSMALANGILQSKGKGQLAILHENIINWVGQNRNPAKKVLVKNFKSTNLKKVDVEKEVLFSKDLHPIIEDSANILEHLQSGGGLIISSQTAVYSNKHERIQIEGHEFLKAIGVALTKQRIFLKEVQNKIQLEESFYIALSRLHLGSWLNHVAKQNPEVIAKTSTEMRNMLHNVPMYVLEPFSDHIKTIFKKCQDHIADAVPRPDKPMTIESHKSAVEILSLLTSIGFGYYKAPGIEHFPGDFKEPLPLECADLEVKSEGISECHPTGYYLPAGIIMKVKVQNTQLPEGWTVRIGAHSDRLRDKKFYKRWPEILAKCSIHKNEVTCFSAYGGGVYIQSPAGEPETLHVRLQHVVESPLYDIDDVDAHWDIRKKAIGPWADISGRHVRITLPSTSIREMDNPKEIMETWDNVLLAQMDLRGIDPQKHKKQWIVFDTQITNGALHSGYPIMGHCGELTNPASDRFILNKKRLLTTGAWGPYHEFGHNLQKGWWTPQGTREVTCNIFALYATEKIADIPAWDNSKINCPEKMKSIQRFLKAGAPYEEWKKTAGIALQFYAQLAHAFGWDTYKAVFRDYESAEKKELPTKNNEKMDQWLWRFSRQAGVSIAPIMYFWGIPFSPEAEEKVQDLPEFLPTDRITELNEQRVKKVLNKYPNMIRSLNTA